MYNLSIPSVISSIRTVDRPRVGFTTTSTPYTLLSNLRRQLLAHEHRRLRIIIVPLARLVSLALVELDGGDEVVLGIEVHPRVERGRKLVQGGKEAVSDTRAARLREDVEALHFAGPALDFDVRQRTQDDAPHHLAVFLCQPYPRVRRKVRVELLWRVPHHDVDFLAVRVDDCARLGFVGFARAIDLDCGLCHREEWAEALRLVGDGKEELEMDAGERERYRGTELAVVVGYTSSGLCRRWNEVLVHSPLPDMLVNRDYRVVGSISQVSSRSSFSVSPQFFRPPLSHEVANTNAVATGLGPGRCDSDLYTPQGLYMFPSCESGTYMASI